MSAVFLCFINPCGPEHFGCNAAQNNIHILLLVCGASVTRPLCISKPISLGRRLSITSIISCELNAHSIKTRFTAPPILLGVEGGDSRGFQERQGAGLPGRGLRQADFLCRRRARRETRGRPRTLRAGRPLPARLACLFLNSLYFPTKG